MADLTLDNCVLIDNSRFFADSNFLDAESNFSWADFANLVNSGFDSIFFLIVLDTEFFFFSISATAWENFFSIDDLCFISFLISLILVIMEFNLYSRPCFSSVLSAKSISLSICSLFSSSRFNLSWAAVFRRCTLSIWATFWLKISLISSAFCLKVSIRFWVDLRDEEYFFEMDFTFLYSFSPLRLILPISDFCVVNFFNLLFNPAMIYSIFVIA